MKLFSKQDQQPSVTFTLEQFRNYYQTAKVVSTENLSDYLYKVKDTFNTAQKRFDSDYDKLGVDVQKSRFEVEHVIKRVKFNNLKDYLVSKPENFKGKYVLYIKDMLETSETLLPSTVKTLTTLKLTIASFINEYKESEIFTLYGADYFQSAKDNTEQSVKTISKYFHKDNSTKAHVGEVLRTFNDVPDIYDTVDSVSRILTIDVVKQINKMADEASGLVDNLIEQNGKTGLLVKNDTAKRELIDALYTSAKQVETVSYLYANLIQFYAAYKKLGDLILDFSKQE